MKTEQAVDNLIKATVQRVIRESVAGVSITLASAYFLQHMPTATARYYGCLLVLISTPFILGVVWSHTLS